MAQESLSGVGPIARYGRYEALFRIAAGGMAEVYAARIVGEGGFEKMVALKRMLPTLAEDDRFVDMFLDEGRVAANISSPNVVQTLDLGRADDDSLYLVMELVVGVSLSALIRRLAQDQRYLPVPVAAEIIAQAAQGLHDAHEARTVYGEPLGIVHRDVSPQNVLVDVSGRARITDFGVARALQRITHTQSGEVKGKLAYFAPEQARAAELDRRADIFALGIVAWETLTSRRLFAGSNPAETLMRLLDMPIPRLDELRPDVPKELADAVAQALERDLEKRTPTAIAFAESIRRGCPSGTPSEVSAFVRAHGGESLMRLEEGLRSQSPSSPSARSVRTRGSDRPSGTRELEEDAPTLVTPSTPMHVADARSGVRTASAPVIPPVVSAPAPIRRGVPLPVVIGVVVLVAAVTAGLALVLGPRDASSEADLAAPAAEGVPPEAETRGDVDAPVEVAAGTEAVMEESNEAALDDAAARAAREGGELPAVDRGARGRTAQPLPSAPAEPPSAPQPVPAAEPAPQPPPPAQPVPQLAPPPRAEPRRSREEPPPPPAPTPARRPDALRGLDDFERELSR